MKIVLFSSGSLSLRIIPYIYEISPEFVLVTKVDKPQGRGMKIKPNIVKQEVSRLPTKIKIYEFSSLKRIESEIERENYEKLVGELKNTDIAISCDIGLIIPKELIDLPGIFINIHPSLLPLYRGPSPIQYALLNGDKLTGITICLLSEEIDKGDIILQSVLEIDEDSNYETLKQQLSELALITLKRFIKLYSEKKLSYLKQDETKATYTKKIKDTILDFSKGVEYLHNQIRAFYPNGYIMTDINGSIKRLKILKTRISRSINLSLSKKGIFLFSKDRLFLDLQGDYGMIEVLELQVEGKKVIDSRAFINGYLK
ncbi:MAG: methionyl-tRNA formyltransferase [Candidatus Calescibacterium sp.]|nr:methionyl-tRNA formyltransferase [Candidatus Calescibacterium sp.]MCX7971881.1 methionyl-tRNA formyltransferase [bacterium]MDW8195020.1 methionyl-tRNA formyltransferase [Candidatus Calescibacterium sp.]